MVDEIFSDKSRIIEKRVIKPQRSRWRRFVKYLAHEFDCENKLELPDVILQCHLDYGHQSLHQAPGKDGIWVWSSNKQVSGFLSRK